MIPIDKQIHFFSAATLALLLYPLGAATAALIVTLAAIGKEVYDKVSGKGTPEIADAFATIVGRP